MIVNTLDVRPASAVHSPAVWSGVVFDAWEDLVGLKAAWDAFVSNIGGDIYFSFDWCRLWWWHYGRGRTLRIFLFRVGHEWAGIVPMFLDRVRLGPVSLRIAKLIGAEFTMTLCNPPIRREYARRIFAEIVEDLLDRQACDAIYMGPMGGTYRNQDDLIHVCRERSDLACVARDITPAPHTVFPLPDTFEEYLDSLDRQRRGGFRRNLSLLSRNFRVEADVIEAPQRAAAEFARFHSLHTRQWQAEGKQGHFGDWPKAEAFTRDLLRLQAAEGRLRLTRLIADGNVVSYQLCYRFGDTWFWRLPARQTGVDWDRYGLGRVGLIKMIESAITEGARAIEAGIGHYDYKLRLGGREFPLRSILIAANHRASRIRAEIFYRLADVLHLLYYRVWFRRLAPRLPVPRQPLWTTWIRSRL